MISQSHYSFQILQPLTDCLRSFAQAETSCRHFPGWSKQCDQNSRRKLRKNEGPNQSNTYTHVCLSALGNLFWSLFILNTNTSKLSSVFTDVDKGTTFWRVWEKIFSQTCYLTHHHVQLEQLGSLQISNKLRVIRYAGKILRLKIFLVLK